MLVKGGIPMIDNIDGFIDFMYEIKEFASTGSIHGNGGSGFWYRVTPIVYKRDDMYCPNCGGNRKMDITLLYPTEYGTQFNINQDKLRDKDLRGAKEYVKKMIAPSLWDYQCTQCDKDFTVLIYTGSNGVEMALFPSFSGGVVTPNTPPAIAYYLDQAYRAKSVGANSACMAMYRAGLEQLLYEQGYIESMLNAKLVKLEKDIADGTAKKWARDWDTDFLKYIKKLGNGCIHTNDGDIEKQKELDNELVQLVEKVFMILLDMVYEQPKREVGWKSVFEDKTKVFERNK